MSLSLSIARTLFGGIILFVLFNVTLCPTNDLKTVFCSFCLYHISTHFIFQHFTVSFSCLWQIILHWHFLLMGRNSFNFWDATQTSDKFSRDPFQPSHFFSWAAIDTKIHFCRDTTNHSLIFRENVHFLGKILLVYVHKKYVNHVSIIFE